ncbi:unnamed protein product [Linum tenue]|uniref:Germin-like protein n=1 Tax=Linum tenue TaxID=586396 RepID=A0AAV0QYX5_9ROSI|nr:unnamed protein product [Linum tenue]
MANQFVLVWSLLLTALTVCCLTSASDPSPLQDFCVADSNSQGIGLHIPGNTANAVGSAVTSATVTQIPGLNTLGISMVRVDYAPWGINPPHTHPRGTEILTVIKGTLEVGFVTSNPDNRLISKILRKGDVFVFPIGLIHFQRNVGHGNAVAIAALSSQNPGVITVANSVFGSKPDISADILAKAFQLDESIVRKLQWTF